MKTYKRHTLVLIVLVVLLGGGYLVLGAGFWSRGLPEGLIQVNGRIEGDHLTVASKFPGRIQELLVREGANVTMGQVMVRIDDVQTRSRVDQARHGWEATRSEEHTSELQSPCNLVCRPLLEKRKEQE